MCLGHEVFCRAQNFGGEARDGRGLQVGAPAAPKRLSGTLLLLLFLLCEYLGLRGSDFYLSGSQGLSPASLSSAWLPQSHEFRTEMASFVPGLRRMAFQAASRSFVCNQCLRQAPRTSPSSILNVVRSRGYATETTQSTSPLGKLAKEMSSRQPPQPETVVAKKAFPKTSSKGVAYWLLGSAASVFGIVVFGGLTRLTESG